MSHFLDVDESVTDEERENKPCYIHGIVYTSGMKYRVTDTLDPKITDPHNDPNYLWDPAVRLTHKQMSQDMTGLPMLFEHQPKHRVGTILHNFLDNKNHLNIIAEVDQKSHLGKWVARNVRAGLLQDLSIGYGTGVQPGTRKVQHKDQIDEVSFVIGGFFPGCEVKVRASKNQGYKSHPPQGESTKQISIVNVMATNTGEVPNQQEGQVPQQTQTQTAPLAAAQAQAPAAAESDPQVLMGVAELKKMFLSLKAENEDLKKKAEGWAEAEEKRRKEYAEANEPKYAEAMAIVEELAKEDGAIVSDKYRDELKYAALNPQAKDMFQNTVRVTASVRKLREEKAALAKQVLELQKTNTLTKDLLQDAALMAPNQAREDKRAAKVAQRNAEQQPLDAVMVPDPDAPAANVPAWLSMVTGIKPGQASQVWSAHGVNQNPNPPIVGAAPVKEPVQSPPGAQASAPPTLAAEQSQAATQPRAVNASMTQRGAPTHFSSRSNPRIKYPRMQGMGAPGGHHGNVWSFIKSVSGDSDGFMTGAHLAGKDFGEIH